MWEDRDTENAKQDRNRVGVCGRSELNNEKQQQQQKYAGLCKGNIFLLFVCPFFSIFVLSVKVCAVGSLGRRRMRQDSSPFRGRPSLVSQNTYHRTPGITQFPRASWSKSVFFVFFLFLLYVCSGKVGSFLLVYRLPPIPLCFYFLLIIFFR